MGARLWVRWAWRDARSRGATLIALALVVAIGAGLFATLGAMKAWRVASADASFAALRAHDVRLTLQEGAFAREGQLAAVARSVDDVQAAEERLSVPVQLRVRSGGRTVLAAGRLIGAPADGSVDALSIEAGRAPRAGAAVLEHNFASHHELPPTGTVELGGRPLTYVGHAMAPEWFVVARGGAVWGAEATYGGVFAPLATAQDLAGRPGTVNDVVVRLRGAADPDAAARALERALAVQLPGLAGSATTLRQENAHRFLYRDAENDQRVLIVFALLILAGAGLVAFNLVNRVVEAQRREIGIGMALGVPPSRLALRPLLLGLQVGVLGAGLGVGVALGTAALFKPLLRDMLPLPVIATPFQSGMFVAGALLGLLIPLAAAVLPVWRSVRVAPIEAIRVGFRSARDAGLAGRLRRLPGRSLMRMPVRNVLRAPRRTVLTALGIAAVIAVIVALGGMIDSFDSTVGRATAEAERLAPDRVVVTLDRFRPVNSEAVRALAGAAAVGAAEPAVVVAAQVRAHGRAVDVVLEVADPSSTLWRPSVVDGSAPAGGTGVLLSGRAADQLGVRPGDAVSVRHPVRTGAATLAAATTRAAVTGIHGSPFRQAAVGGAAWPARMRLDGAANTLWVLPAPGTTTLDVRDALSGREGVAIVEDAAAASRTLEEAMEQFGAVLQVGWVFALALALLMAFNAATINAEERRREHATMFAFGVGPRSVLAVQVVEAVLVGVLATALGVALGRVLLAWIVHGLVPDTFPDLGIDTALSAATFAAAGIAGIVAMAAGPLLTLRRVRRMDVPSALRVME
jgi:putative ABC transport system permease protein